MLSFTLFLSIDLLISGSKARIPVHREVFQSTKLICKKESVRLEIGT
jgi:hypothetical protein